MTGYAQAYVCKDKNYSTLTQTTFFREKVLLCAHTGKNNLMLNTFVRKTEGMQGMA